MQVYMFWVLIQVEFLALHLGLGLVLGPGQVFNLSFGVKKSSITWTSTGLYY